MFDNCIQVVPLFGQFWVKTKVTKVSEIVAPLTQTALHSLISVFEIANAILTLSFRPSESSLFPLSSDRQIEFLHNKIKC